MRPTVKELGGKILKAREKASAKEWLAANAQKLMAQFDELDCFTDEEQNEAVEGALNEIQPQHYAGARPPDKSHEDACVGAEMFAFVWDSQHFKCRMYLKCCFVRDTLFIVSLHKAKW
jgi:hypothetical protein